MTEGDGPESKHDLAAFGLDRNPRLALWAFGVIEGLALAFYLWAGRDRWFFGDEWSFLITRDGGDLHDALRPTNEHWTTLPILVYRGLFNVFGINTYVPYQLVTISLHLAAAALLRVVMRRAGVSAWMATVAATVFVFFGSGDHNILRAFQMTFGGALVFGLTHLLLADHDGPISRRDWFGLLAGLAGLMCSAVAPALLVAVGVATLVRRGWRIALFHLVPLALVYGVWWWTLARDRYTRTPSTVVEMWSFVWSAVSSTFSAVSQVPMVGLLLTAILVVGLALAWAQPGPSDFRRRGVLPAALMIGAAFFVATTAWSRASLGPEFATQSRYMHIIVALLLPAIAVAADALTRRWRVLIPVVLAGLLVGIPGNVNISRNQSGAGRGLRSDREVYLAFPRLPDAADAPPWARPDPTNARQVTLGWLRDGVAAGRVPDITVTPDMAYEAGFRLALQQVPGTAPTQECERIVGSPEVHLEPGEYLAFRGALHVFEADEATRRPRVTLRFDSGPEERLHAILRPLDLTIRTAPGSAPPLLCGVHTPG